MDRWTLVANKLNHRFGLQLEGSGWGAGAKTLRTAALSLIYSTAECCASAWCCSAHTHLTDSVVKDTLRIVTGCLRPTPSDNLSVLSGIQPAKLCRQGVTLSLANRSSLDPGHILHGQLTEPLAASKEKLKSRHPFVSAARKLLHNLSELSNHAAQSTNLTWDTEYSKSMSALGVFIPSVSTRPIAMSLTRTVWVKLNRRRTSVGRFGSSMHKWGLAPSAKCECGARKQTADHIVFNMSHTSGTSRNNGSDSFG